MWTCVTIGAISGIAAAKLDRPGGVIHVRNPSDVQWLPKPEPAKECQGCGAPLKAYIHHCEYCRREK